MIVNEMIRRLRVSLGDSIEPYQISTDQLYLLLQTVYMDIQRKSVWWKFLHKKGLLLTTVADVEDYSTARVERINLNSVYGIADGTTARIPLVVTHYEDWAADSVSQPITSNNPLELIHTPSFKWKVYPIPTTIWRIYADYWLKPEEFGGLNDEPIWDEHFHELVLLKAMQTASALKPGSREAELMLAQVNASLLGLERRFANKYLDSARRAEPLL